MFLIFSLLLSWRLGKQKSIRCGRRSRSRWITRPGSGRAACLGQPWAKGGGGKPREYHQRPRAGHRFRSGAPLRGTKKKSKVFTVWARKWEISFHTAPGEPPVFSLHSFIYFFASFLRTVVASVPLSLHTSLLTPFGWYTGPEPVIMPTLQIWAQNISTPGSVIIR